MKKEDIMEILKTIAYACLILISWDVYNIRKELKKKNHHKGGDPIEEE
jgi:hypothetical protein